MAKVIMTCGKICSGKGTYAGWQRIKSRKGIYGSRNSGNDERGL